MNPTEVKTDSDYKMVLGQILNHIGTSLEGGNANIDIHGSNEKQAIGIKIIGQLIKNILPEQQEQLLTKLEETLELKRGSYHILNLAQELLSNDWENRIGAIRKEQLYQYGTDY